MKQIIKLFPEDGLKRITYPSLFLLALTLSACGGGGSDSPAASDPPSNPPPSNASPGTTTPPPSNPAPQTLSSVAQIVDYYGDSTIRGYQSGTGAQVAKSAPQAFAEALSSSPAQQVNNLGVDGQTACQLFNGTDWAGTMASSNATVVILNHGINDATTGLPLSDYRSCLTDLARAAKSAGKRVIFETPNPIDSGGLENYVSAMKAVATQENLPIIDQYENLIQSGRPIREICPDGTHPSDAVYIEKGRYAASVYVRIPL
jgi:lysophospholipase L1-like esterase